jgi:hypothetical protein
MCGWAVHYVLVAQRGFTTEVWSEGARYGTILIDAVPLDAKLS